MKHPNKNSFFAEFTTPATQTSTSSVSPLTLARIPVLLPHSMSGYVQFEFMSWVAALVLPVHSGSVYVKLEYPKVSNLSTRTDSNAQSSTWMLHGTGGDLSQSLSLSAGWTFPQTEVIIFQLQIWSDGTNNVQYQIGSGYIRVDPL